MISGVEGDPVPRTQTSNAWVELKNNFFAEGWGNENERVGSGLTDFSRESNF